MLLIAINKPVMITKIIPSIDYLQKITIVMMKGTLKEFCILFCHSLAVEGVFYLRLTFLGIQQNATFGIFSCTKMEIKKK